MDKEIIKQINKLGGDGEPFLFVINYQGDQAYIRKLSEIDPKECLYDFDGRTNVSGESIPGLPSEVEWEVDAPRYEDYERSFDKVMSNLQAGNSCLVNLTCRVPVRCNLSLRDIFFHSQGKYKILLNAAAEIIEPFVCFSPEIFLRIKGGRIYSYPMKGTIDATLPNAERQLMEDEKEAAEHVSVVDLIRKDLSKVSSEVRVDRYRYVDLLHTNKGDILQTSSEISGKLPDDYRHHIGDILAAQLPAGSIAGAPKDDSCRIIQEAETYARGFYTGIMGICEDGKLDSSVMIRFVEQERDGKVFKAGGGVTSKSQCRREYEEMLRKVYLPIVEAGE